MEWRAGIAIAPAPARNGVAVTIKHASDSVAERAKALADKLRVVEGRAATRGQSRGLTVSTIAPDPVLTDIMTESFGENITEGQMKVTRAADMPDTIEHPCQRRCHKLIEDAHLGQETAKPETRDLL
ncbi:hypothetical protein GGR53DRAFT_463708 [Hypoxylon sp. FL1150]|nr:hypothetical protein GGR53DRAFT_463708 [Hypoxylon sp. FL1150]